MSAKSNPCTGSHAALSKISETSSRALMGANLTRSDQPPSPRPPVTLPVTVSSVSVTVSLVSSTAPPTVEHRQDEEGAAFDVVGAGRGAGCGGARGGGAVPPPPLVVPPPPLVVPPFEPAAVLPPPPPPVE